MKWVFASGAALASLAAVLVPSFKLGTGPGGGVSMMLVFAPVMLPQAVAAGIAIALAFGTAIVAVPQRMPARRMTPMALTSSAVAAGEQGPS